ncbi:glutamate receptor 2.7-like [Cornus florida]|uniref:glutamate receptor 2.7-like n=1 Tax=Cornus florida TaxID=4283 RepID=UPI0028A245B3|nr:glutamate receptor 2.7-like [Cornus florida]
MVKLNMPLQVATINTTSKPTFFFSILMSFLLIFSYGSITAADNKITSIGAIIDVNSHSGKEQKTAIQIAVQNFNNKSMDHKLSLHFSNFSNPGKDPLEAVYAADELIKENQVQVILGMETWNEAALVAEIGNRAEVPTISFAASASPPHLSQHRWPFLVQMATNSSEEVSCIAAILHSYNWKLAIAIYEDDMYGGNSEMLALFSEALQTVGVEIEHRLVFPSFSSLSDQEGFVHEEVAKLLSKQSRVFVVLQSSVSMATHLFKEAKQLGLMGPDSVWIITDSVSSLLEYVNNSVISSMQGAIGIKTYYSEDSKSYLDFKGQFRRSFLSDYPEEDDSMPGIHALRAYDGITSIGHAAKRIGNGTSISKMLLDNILSSNFTGLSGDIRFHDGRLSHTIGVRIINVIGRKYKDIGFWSSKFGFSESLAIEPSGEIISSGTGGDSMEDLGDVVNSLNWPGNLKRVPKGWAMPTDAKKMKIGVPGRTSFEKFVKVEETGNPNSPLFYSGFCIHVFEEVLKILEQSYSLPYEFVPYNGSYDALVDHVINESYDAVIGDVTILANRSRYVEFTQPFAESGLYMIVPVKSEAQKAWMFLKPFTAEMWMVTGAIVIYTMVIVWFLEHQSNPEFRGPWKDQLGMAMWFTFSSLFFAHREKIHSNLTRVVVVVWLFVVVVINSSYTASLTSMLTVSRLEPNVTDIEWLRRTNAPVGCDGDSFVKDYLKNVLHFKSENIKNVSKEYDYPGEFKSGNITAAFLEIPYAKVFLKENCNKYTVSGPTYRFGGLGFVFQKGSPIAADVSEAILSLSENGKLRILEEDLFTSSLNCTNTETNQTDSLSLQSFWGLYLISGGTSTLCFLYFLFRLVKNYRRHEGNMSTPAHNGVWGKTVELARYFHNGGTRRPAGRAPTPRLDEWSSSRWEYVSPSDATEDCESSTPPEQIEIPIATDSSST